MIKSESGTDQSSHFGGGLLENIRCVRAAIAQLVEGLVPETHKYVLWAAETGTGLYRKAADGREEGEEQKKFVIDNSGKTAKLVIKIKEEVGRKASADTESLITELQLSDEVLDELYQTRSAVRVLSQNIQANVSKLFEHSNSIIKEVCALDKLLGERVFGRMTPEAAAKFAKWVEKVL